LGGGTVNRKGATGEGVEFGNHKKKKTERIKKELQTHTGGEGEVSQSDGDDGVFFLMGGRDETNLAAKPRSETDGGTLIDS